MGFFPFLLGASIAMSPLQAAVPQVQAQARPVYPALWVVNDGDTIIYLFGTFHALDGRSQWFGQAVKTAFTQSDELMLETVVPKPGARGSNSTAKAEGQGKLGTTEQGHPPSPIAQLAPSASFLASTKLVMTAGRAKGMSTDRGADAVLRDAADEAGKPVGGLESFNFQLNMFSTITAGPQLAAPAQDPRMVQALGAVLAQLQAAWNRGAVEETFTPLLRQMQVQSPRTYNVMFVERNARWANWIADRLDSPGTVFVAVGAGHLSGPDSVQKQLASLGVRSARVN